MDRSNRFAIVEQRYTNRIFERPQCTLLDTRLLALWRLLLHPHGFAVLADHLGESVAKLELVFLGRRRIPMANIEQSVFVGYQKCDGRRMGMRSEQLDGYRRDLIRRRK